MSSASAAQLPPPTSSSNVNNANVNGEHKNWRELYEKLQSEFQEFCSQSKELESELDTQLAQAQQSSTRLEGENALLKRQLNDLRMQKTITDAENTKTISQLRVGNGDLQQKVQQQALYVARLETEIDELSTGKRVLEQTTGDNAEKIEALQEQCAMLETELQFEKNSHSEIVQRLRDRVRELEEDMQARSVAATSAAGGGGIDNGIDVVMENNNNSIDHNNSSSSNMIPPTSNSHHNQHARLEQQQQQQQQHQNKRIKASPSELVMLSTPTHSSSSVVDMLSTPTSSTRHQPLLSLRSPATSATAAAAESNRKFDAEMLSKSMLPNAAALTNGTATTTTASAADAEMCGEIDDCGYSSTPTGSDTATSGNGSSSKINGNHTNLSGAVLLGSLDAEQQPQHIGDDYLHNHAAVLHDAGIMGDSFNESILLNPFIQHDHLINTTSNGSNNTRVARAGSVDGTKSSMLMSKVTSPSNAVANAKAFLAGRKSACAVMLNGSANRRAMLHPTSTTNGIKPGSHDSNLPQPRSHHAAAAATSPKSGIMPPSISGNSNSDTNNNTNSAQGSWFRSMQLVDKALLKLNVLEKNVKQQQQQTLTNNASSNNNNNIPGSAGYYHFSSVTEKKKLSSNSSNSPSPNAASTRATTANGIVNTSTATAANTDLINNGNGLLLPLYAGGDAVGDTKKQRLVTHAGFGTSPTAAASPRVLSGNSNSKQLSGSFKPNSAAVANSHSRLPAPAAVLLSSSPRAGSSTSQNSSSMGCTSSSASSSMFNVNNNNNKNDTNERVMSDSNGVFSPTMLPKPPTRALHHNAAVAAAKNGTTAALMRTLPTTTTGGAASAALVAVPPHQESRLRKLSPNTRGVLASAAAATSTAAVAAKPTALQPRLRQPSSSSTSVVK